MFGKNSGQTDRQTQRDRQYSSLWDFQIRQSKFWYSSMILLKPTMEKYINGKIFGILHEHLVLRISWVHSVWDQQLIMNDHTAQEYPWFLSLIHWPFLGGWVGCSTSKIELAASRCQIDRGAPSKPESVSWWALTHYFLFMRGFSFILWAYRINYLSDISAYILNNNKLSEPTS